MALPLSAAEIVVHGAACRLRRDLLPEFIWSLANQAGRQKGGCMFCMGAALTYRGWLLVATAGCYRPCKSFRGEPSGPDGCQPRQGRPGTLGPPFKTFMAPLGYPVPLPGQTCLAQRTCCYQGKSLHTGASGMADSARSYPAGCKVSSGSPADVTCASGGAR